MKRKHILILIILLVIGFATVSTALIINGNVGVGVDLDDFDVIFIEALLDGKETDRATISEDNKTITFTTDKFINKGDSARLDYKVKNTSTQYDADVTINCTNEANEYVTVTGSFDGNDIPLVDLVNIQAQEVKNGCINAELTKAYAGEDASIEIKCSIVFTATSRENYAYSLVFDSQGGSKVEEKVLILNDSYGELETPERKGYTFLGWYDENDVKVDETTILDSKGNRTLYAKWIGEEWKFDYTGGEQIFTVPYDGTYKIELWGAQGSNYSSKSGGKGAYTRGAISLKMDTDMYVYVGQAGSMYGGTQKVNSFNGGGNGNFFCIELHPTYIHNVLGGGATDIRLQNGSWNDSNSLKSRIMVAGGGGGSTAFATGGAAGGLTGYAGEQDSRLSGNYSGTGGTQTSGGSVNAKFGVGGDANYSGNVCSYNDGAGGGSGYYGGGGCKGTASRTGGTGGGGSSFISGHSGCNAINSSGTHTGQPNHYSGYVFTDTSMIAGNENMPTHDGTGIMTGNSGNGYAKITYLGD